MRETPWLEAERLARSAAALADAAEALDAMAAAERRQAVREEEGVLIYRPSALREIRRRVAGMLIDELVSGAKVRGPELDRLLAALDDGGSATLAGVLARAEGGEWSFRLAPPRRP